MRGGSCTAAVACLTLALAAAGCGSSSTSSTASTSSSPSTSTATASTPHVSSGPGGSLKATTTPKFATPEPSAPVQSGLVQIAYRDIAIDPDTLRVKVGSTIRWTNYDPVDHNVTSIGPGPLKFASKEFGENGTFEIKVDRPGVIHYESTTQPATMNGTIEVVG
jgi:plastocyanin